MPHPIVISPTIDSATVDATRWLIHELRADGMPVEVVADIAAEHLADAVHLYGKDYDPTDAELAVAWNSPDSHEAHRAAWALHTELRS